MLKINKAIIRHMPPEIDATWELILWSLSRLFFNKLKLLKIFGIIKHSRKNIIVGNKIFNLINNLI